MTLATGGAGAEPIGPEPAGECGATVTGTAGQDVSLSSDVVGETLRAAIAEVPQLLPAEVRDLLPDLAALPPAYVVGQVQRTDSKITEDEIIGGIFKALPQQTVQSLRKSALFKIALFPPAGQCVLNVQPLPEKPQPPKNPVPSPRPGSTPPSVPQPRQPVDKTPANLPPVNKSPVSQAPVNQAPAHQAAGPSTAPKPAKPPRPAKPGHARNAAPAGPDVPLVAPREAPGAGAIGGAGEPVFDQPLNAAAPAPAVHYGQDPARSPAPVIAPAGHATALPADSRSDRQEQVGAALLVGVLALSAAVAGLVRTTARRGTR